MSRQIVTFLDKEVIPNLYQIVKQFGSKQQLSILEENQAELKSLIREINDQDILQDVQCFINDQKLKNIIFLQPDGPITHKDLMISVTKHLKKQHRKYLQDKLQIGDIKSSFILYKFKKMIQNIDQESAQKSINQLRQFFQMCEQ